MELIRLENICKTYCLGEVEVPVLRGISLSIERGEMVALMGASGSGKSTLMNILGCLDHPTSGKYWLDGRETSLLTPNERALVRTEKLGFVFQSFNLLARTSAIQNVLMPLDYSPRRCSGRDSRRLALTLLDRVGLSECAVEDVRGTATTGSRAMTQITELLRQRHRIRPGDEEDFSIRYMAEIMKVMSSTTQLMSSLLLVVAMISLIVGGVGSPCARP